MPNHDWKERLASELAGAKAMRLRALKDNLKIQAAMLRLHKFAEEVRRLPDGLKPEPDDSESSA